MLRSNYDIVQNQKKTEKRIVAGLGAPWQCLQSLDDDEIGAVGDFGG